MAHETESVNQPAGQELTAPVIVTLDADHPGFQDAVYRERRNAIARAAIDYHEGRAPFPTVAYTPEEHEVWREVWRHLDPLHKERACKQYLDAAEKISLSRKEIPQLLEVSEILEPHEGFRMAPVAGLVSAHGFLSPLSGGTFLSTQYMRHHSVPLYTPEPDVVHELVGHAAALAQEDFARLNRAFGRAAHRSTTEEQLAQLERLYWYTLEFGVVKEDDELKVFGAGLLSSFGELARIEREGKLREWDVELMARTPYDPTMYQPELFVAPSFKVMHDDLLNFLDRI